MSRDLRRHLPLQVYLLAVMLVAVTATLGLQIYQQQIRVEKARSVAEESMEFVARLGAADIAEAVKTTEQAVADVAANPGLPALFDTPTPQGCSLTFTGAGPFTRGHIDIIDRSGRVLCSSRPLPGGTPYAEAEWVGSESARVMGPFHDPATGNQALVVLSPVADLGVVATLLDVESAPEDLANRYGAVRGTRFEVDIGGATSPTDARPPTDTIARTADVPSRDWTVRAWTGESERLAEANATNRHTTFFTLLALLIVLGAIQLIYFMIVRPMKRLSSSVRQATSGNGIVEPPDSGPAEVVSLGGDFATLTTSVASELSRRETAEKAARESAESYRTIFEGNPHPTWVHHGEDGRLLAVNAAMVERFGWSRDELLSMHREDLVGDQASELASVLAGAETIDRSGPWVLRDRDGSLVDCLITSDVLRLSGTPARIVVAEDVTVQLRTERLLARTQRMESLGQLAGGIAHDFNNVLAVMLNYAEFAGQELAVAAGEDPARWGPVLTDVQQIGTAGDRAAGLTRQLLSFARGDALDSSAVNINDVATGIEELLRRTLGEQVQLELDLDPQLWPVTGNVGQLEQVIVNLAVNARDAMPDGGRLSVETVNVEVDSDHTASRPERAPGRYVRLRVNDTGTGMDAEARDHAFEPFFTTKDPASGTGLGLATVYGVVHRAGGTVDIYSEIGLGTTVSIYFPVADGHVEASVDASPAARPEGGTETVLLVEDDEALRTITERILADGGYQVLSAQDGPSAVVTAEQRRGEIGLLLTDVVMPNMLGSELAIRVTGADPRIKVLFMSGYAPPVLLNGGTLPHNSAMLDKPFSAALLLQKVRQVLDS